MAAPGRQAGSQQCPAPPAHAAMADLQLTGVLAGVAVGAAGVFVCGRSSTSTVTSPSAAPVSTPPSASGPATESVGDFTARQLVEAAGPAATAHREAISACAMHYLHARDDYVHLMAKLHEKCGGEKPADHLSSHDGEASFNKLLLAEFEASFAEYFSMHWDDPDGLLALNKLPVVGGVDHKTSKASSTKWGTAHKLLHRKFVEKSLKAQREFLTLAEIMESTTAKPRDPQFPNPVVRMLGGGMAAGKSTVVGMLKDGWKDAVVIEADAFKMHDPIFAQLNVDEQGANEVGMVVHSHSTGAANEELLAALLNQRDVVMDGTMTWKPFVEQTIAMIRRIHEREYCLGPGWDPATKTELYWEDVGPRSSDSNLLPYRVEMVGVTVDPSLAVGRGLRRKMVTGRGVPVAPQLRSHRLFSMHFEDYLPLLDEAALYDTTVGSGGARLVASYTGKFGGRLLSNCEDYTAFQRKAFLDDKAIDAARLYTSGGTGARPRPAVAPEIVRVLARRAA